jgi:hypothetical protein
VCVVDELVVLAHKVALDRLRLVLVPAQRHNVVFGLLPLFLQRDTNLLSADRVDVVIEFWHVILPFLHSAADRQRSSKL